MNTLEIMHGPYMVRPDAPVIAARTLMYFNGSFNTPTQDMLDQHAQQISAVGEALKGSFITPHEALSMGQLLEVSMVDLIMSSHMHEDSISRAA